MELVPGARDRIIATYSKAHGIDPAVIRRIIADVEASDQGAAARPGASPFAISWMDSYLGHWEFRQDLRPPDRAVDDVVQLLRELIDVRFRERLEEIREVIRVRGVASPPDGGPPPEPGVPPAGPAGPASIFAEPPDGGPPEPGVPPTGPTSIFAEPDGGPPDGGPPDAGPPEPGVPPPAGPDLGFLEENPWILYWFISVKAPLLLDVMDAHLSRRLSEVAAQLR